MIRRSAAVFGCWLLVAELVWAQSGDYNVSAPSRLEWEFVARRFQPVPANTSGKYQSKRQRYQLYVPDKYTKSKSWPLIVFISPSMEPIGWDSFQKTCETGGYLFCSPYAAGNDVPAGMRARIVLDAIDDVRRRFRIDPDQTYIGGFSGGGRMACDIGFSFPEVFAGIIPVCGTNPFNNLAYLRHRLQERVSVALVTGEEDANRRENEVWVAPYMKEVGVRHELWIVGGLGHEIPGPKIMDDVITWLNADLERRQEDSRDRPLLNQKSNEAFRDNALASRLVAAAKAELEKDQRVWHAVAILNGVITRWPKSDATKNAIDLLKTIDNDERLYKELTSLRKDDDRKSSVALAHGLERFGRISQAIEVWQSLGIRYPGSPIEEEVQSEIQRLEKFKPATDTRTQPKAQRRGPSDRKGQDQNE